MDKSFCNKTEANLHYQSLGSLRFKVKKFWWTFIFPTNSPYYIRQSFVIFVNFDQNHHSTSTKKINSQFLKKNEIHELHFRPISENLWLCTRVILIKKRRIYCMILCFLIDIVFFSNCALLSTKKRRISLFKTQYHFFSRFFWPILA